MYILMDLTLVWRLAIWGVRLSALDYPFIRLVLLPFFSFATLSSVEVDNSFLYLSDADTDCELIAAYNAAIAAELEKQSVLLSVSEGS